MEIRGSAPGHRLGGGCLLETSLDLTLYMERARMYYWPTDMLEPQWQAEHQPDIAHSMNVFMSRIKMIHCSNMIMALSETVELQDLPNTCNDFFRHHS